MFRATRGSDPLPPVAAAYTVPKASNVRIFTPNQLTGCVLWLDAADTTTLFQNSAGTTPIAANGNTVAYWKDKSASGNNATNTVSQPTVIFNARNSLPVVNFNGSQYLTLSTSTLPTGSTQCSFFFVTRTTSLGVQVFFTYGANPNNTNQNPQFYYGSGNLATDTYGASGLSDSTNTVNSYVITSCIFTTVNNAWRNGTSFSGVAPAVTLNTGTGWASLGVGRVTSTLTYYLTGQIGEVIVYNRPVTSDERQRIEGYLAWKWSLNTSLPSSAPYFPTPVYANPPFPLVSYVKSGSQKLFNPLNIANGYLWLDAADSASLSFSGSVVTNVKNKVNNANLTPTGTSTSSLTLVKNSIGTNQSLFFNNLASYNVYLQGSLTNISTGSSFVVWKALNQKVMPQWSPFFTWYSKTLSVYGSYPAFGYLGNEANLTVGPYTSFASPNGTPKTQTTANTNYLAFYSWNNTNTNVGFNGQEPTAGTQPAFSGTTTTFLIGEDGDTTGDPTAWATTNMYLGEVLIYNTIISASQRQQIEGYLAWKWGLQGSLPANHPFKQWPPSP
jgi:hypothetical protein